MGDILFESAAPPLELPAPIEQQTLGATKVASFCLAGAAVLGWLSGCSSSESSREAAPLPPMPPSNPNSAPPSPEWSPTPPFVSPTPSATASSASPRASGGAGGSKVGSFQCTHIAEVDKLGKDVFKITVGGTGEVTSRTYTGVLEADGMTRLYPGKSFEYKPPDDTPIAVVMPAGGVWTTAGKVLLSEYVYCGTVPNR